MIGGGPGGASAAISLAAEGRSVALVTRPTRTPRPGQTIHASTVDRLRVLGFHERHLRPHRRIARTISLWGKHGDARAIPAGQSWVLDRERFDQTLLELARSAGVTVFAPAWADTPVRSAGRWSVQIHGEAATCDATALTLIDASGRVPVMGRALPLSRAAVDKLVAIWWVIGEGSLIQDDASVVESTERGWWFSCPIDGGSRTFCFFTDGDLLDHRRLRSASCLPALAGATVGIRSLLRREVDCTRVPFGITSANTSFATPPAGPGWALVGDAAFTVDPLSSQGISLAVELGTAAARSILEGEQALPAYADHALDRFRGYLDGRASYYRLETRWPSAPFWARRTSPPRSAQRQRLFGAP